MNRPDCPSLWVGVPLVLGYQSCKLRLPLGRSPLPPGVFLGSVRSPTVAGSHIHASPSSAWAALCLPSEGGDWSLLLLLTPSLRRPLPRSSARYTWLHPALPLRRVSLTLPHEARLRERKDPLSLFLTLSHLAAQLGPQSHTVSLREKSSVIFWAKLFSAGFNLSPSGRARRQWPPHPIPYCPYFKLLSLSGKHQSS